ncbi:hypothetical protein GCM10011504_55000 [Siccirubricoccus deserti]|nr:hypothetical protein GCM10011504_55000 [Siccirubricoccus deserti]
MLIFAQIGSSAMMGKSSSRRRSCSAAGEAPALLCGTLALPVGTHSLALKTTWDLPSLVAGATAVPYVAVTEAQGRLPST